MKHRFAGLPRESTTLAQAFDPRANSLNALRLLFAVLVIVSHSWPVGGYGEDPGWGDQDLGDWAVAGFFVVSGYLITMSRLNARSFADYAWRRMLRIYPAFFISLCAVAFLFAPLSVLLASGSYNLLAGVQFVAQNMGVLILQPTIAGTLGGSPVPDVWNGSLWTLFYEVVCYAAVGALVSLCPKRMLNAVVVAAFAACTLLLCIEVFSPVEIPILIVKGARLGAYFAAGAVLLLFGKRARFNAYLLAAAAMLVALTILTSTFQVFAGLPLAYLVLALSTSLPLRTVGRKNDISYGMYIYAFPVQQILALALAGSGAPVPVFIGLSVLLTVPFAYLSWVLIERPLMRFKALVARRAGDRDGNVQPPPMAMSRS